MNRREKLILIACAALVVIGILYGMLNSLLLGPKAELQEKIAADTKKLARQEGRADQHVVYERKLAALVAKTHTGGFDDGLATQHTVTQRLRLLAIESGLPERTLSFVPVKAGPEDGKGKFRQLAWNVKIRGNLTDVTDFVYMLNHQPYVQRIENLKVHPDLAGGVVDMSFRYLTLALLPKTKAPTTAATTQPTTQPTSQPAPVDLEAPQRRLYDAIASRDLFRPYMKRPAPPPPRPPKVPRDPGPPPPPPSTDGHFRVVGLPNWSGDPSTAMIVVTDTRNRHTVEHNLGDTIGGGKIVLVDYRPMPLPGEAEILSPSRVIIKIKGRYWAVELGHTLAQKHVLKNKQLPVGLLSETPEAAAGTPADAGANPSG